MLGYCLLMPRLSCPNATSRLRFTFPAAAAMASPEAWASLF